MRVWCRGKWDTVGTHGYSREGQMRSWFTVWAANHVHSERGITQLILLIWIWQAYSRILKNLKALCVAFLVLKFFCGKLLHFWNNVMRKRRGENKQPLRNFNMWKRSNGNFKVSPMKKVLFKLKYFLLKEYTPLLTVCSVDYPLIWLVKP